MKTRTLLDCPLSWICPQLVWFAAGAALCCAAAGAEPPKKAVPVVKLNQSAVPARVTNAVPIIIPQRVDPATVIDRRGIGASIFSTGLEPIRIRIIPKTREYPTYHSHIYVVYKGKTQYVGHNYESRAVNLGILPPDELTFLINDHIDPVASSGPAGRNADGLPHAIARDVAEGLVEVRFEDSKNLPEEKLVYGDATAQEYARKNYFGDVILELTGGVTADPAVPGLLQSLRSDDPAQRKSAAEALEKMHPRIAQGAGLLRPGAAGR